MRFAQALLPALLLTRALPAAADSLTDLFPPETKAVLGIRVHNIASSPFVKELAAQARAAGDGWLKMVAPPGFDPFRDIDEVMLATSAQGQNPPVLVVITGRFDVAKLAEGATRYHDVPVLAGGENGDSAIALLDNETALAGNVALIHSAIDRRAGGAKIDPALNDRITSLRQRYDVWGLGERTEGFAAPMPEAKVLESIDRFQFGLQLSSGLELGAEIHARSSKDAGKLSESLQMIAALLKSQPRPDSASKFDLQVDGGTIKLSVFIPEAELKKAIESQKAALSPTKLPAVTTAAPEPTPEIPAVTPPPVDPPKPVAKAGPNAGTSQVLDKSGNTVVLKLPGKK